MTVIAGRYRLDTLLGQGGTGEVWRAYDLRLERPVALKLLHRSFARDDDARRRLRREADALARLRNEHVVGLLDVDENAERPFIVQEFLPGGTLSPIAAAGPHPWERVRPIALGIAKALEHAHAAGVVHRDLKPSNVLFGADGHLFVADFGLARLLSSDDGTLTATGTRLGSPEYWSPEQASGLAASEKADIYALGVIAFQLVTGQLPFAGEDRLAAGYRRVHEDAPRARAVRPSVPPGVDDLIARMMRRDPAARPRAADVVRELEDPSAAGAAASASATVGSAPTRQLEAATAVLRDDAPTRVAGATQVSPPADRTRIQPPPGGDAAPWEDAPARERTDARERGPVVRPPQAPAYPGARAPGAVVGIALAGIGAGAAVALDATVSTLAIGRGGVDVSADASAHDAGLALGALAGIGVAALGLVVLVVWAVRSSGRARHRSARVVLAVLAVVLAAVASAGLVWAAYAIANADPAALWTRATG